MIQYLVKSGPLKHYIGDEDRELLSWTRSFVNKTKKETAMTVKPDLPPLPPFDPLSEPSSLSQRWKTWTKRFEMYVAAMKIDDDKQKRALLLYQAGQETQEIFETLTETGDDYATAKKKLDDYFSPKKNVDYEIFQFRQAVQQKGETVDQFATRLRKLGANCEFHDIDKELKSAIIQNCHSKRLRRYALREEALTLDALLAKARSLEASERQATGMERSLQDESVQNVRSKGIKGSGSQIKGSGSQMSTTKCRKCGLSWPHKTGPCPAKGQTCRKCGKPNHFARMCLSKTTGRQTQQPKAYGKKSRIRQVSAQETDTSSSSDDEYLYTLKQGAQSAKTPNVPIQVNGVTIDMVVDTGASVDILDEATFDKINHSSEIQLQPPTKRLFAYGSKSQLTVLGKFEATIAFKTKSLTSTVHVLPGDNGSLLGYKTATSLGVIDVHVNKIATEMPEHERLIAQYPNLFKGIGNLKGVEVKLHIDKEVPPVAQQARRIPFHLRKQVEQELQHLETQGIIEDVEGPTPWVSPLVIIPKKNGEVRLCIDMRMANRAIKRERHLTPTTDDLIHTLNGATVFSKLDLRSGYHQLSLSRESRYITTFATHKGLKRYTRLNFGTNSASEIFQKIVNEQIRDIPGALNISDDVIIFGKTQAEHDAALCAVFKRFSEINLTLNKKKCEFNKPSLTFFGFVFSSQGIAPDPRKVEAIKAATPPTTASEVRSFLGMATYCAKFIPNFSDVSQPLRDLTKKDCPFQWSEKHDQAFQQIKDLLTNAKVMAYFDPSKDTELVTDASPWGLSAILMQKSSGQDDRRVVAYASRALSDVERRYSQTEREALAIVWAIERLHVYLYGSHFTLLTDCKPVQLILDNPQSKPPARIERWNLRVQGYDFDVVHTKGSSNPSDFLSRHPVTVEDDSHGKLAEDYVYFLTSHAVPKAMSLAEIEQATAEDATLKCLMDLLHTGKWHQIDTSSEEVNKDELRLFKRVQSELTVSGDSKIILRGSRIVIPAVLRERAISIAHEGHQGLVKTKKLLREKVWFPGIDSMVKQKVEQCLACQANGPESHPDPLQMSPLPPKPWHTLNMDFCGPLPTGEYLFVIIDAYSRFPEVEIVHSTSARAIIPKMDRIFATHGIPDTIRSDNGPPFTSNEIRDYMRENGINHRKITPLWPQANSEAENFMKPLTKAVRSANVEGRQWKKDLYRFLLNYRATPHTTTGFAPAELLFHRKIQTKLPQLQSLTIPPDVSAQVIENDANAKAKMKAHADKRAQTSTMKVGDLVLVRQRKQNKLSTRYNPNPFSVIRIKGTMVTARRKDKYITRNSSHFKVISGSMEGVDESSDEEEEEIEGSNTPTAANAQPRVAEPNPNPQRRYPLRNRKSSRRFGNNVYDQ